MKLLLLAGASAIHTQRWANGLAEAGVAVTCASLHPFLPQGWDPRVEAVRLPAPPALGYFTQGPRVAALHAERGCTVLQAHYASGYGTLARRSGVRPSLLSVWGSDVYDFPRHSPLHRAWLQRNLRAADRLASTSVAMAGQVARVLGASPPAGIAITPFGVDTAQFAPPGGPRDDDPSRALVVGTVKTLAAKYGIDTLIQAFARLPPVPGRAPTRLRLVGGGAQRGALEALARRLGVAAQVDFVGPVAHAAVPAELARLDVYVAASRLDSESFGVAVLEASACARPVVVSRVGGLPEVVVDGRTGLIVPREDPAALARAIGTLLADAPRRQAMGAAGRLWVQQRYDWRDSVARMLSVLREVEALGAGAAR